MEIKITLGRSHGKLENKVETLADESVIFKFESEYVLSHVIIHVSDGKDEEKYERYKLEEFVLPKKFVKAGELFIGVDLVAKGVVAKHFDVEPLVLKETDTELNFIPLLWEQNRKIGLLEQTNNELHDKVVAQDLQIKVLQGDVARLFEIVEQQP